MGQAEVISIPRPRKRSDQRSTTQPTTLEEVYAAVLRVVTPHYGSPHEDIQLRLDVAAYLGQLVAKGVNDPRALRRRAIEHMIFARLGQYGDKKASPVVGLPPDNRSRVTSRQFKGVPRGSGKPSVS